VGTASDAHAHCSVLDAMPQPKEQIEIGTPSEEPEREADEATESIEEESDVESPRKAREPHEDKGFEARNYELETLTYEFEAAAAIQRPPSDS
jgi:hypothetical protein